MQLLLDLNSKHHSNCEKMRLKLVDNLETFVGAITLQRFPAAVRNFINSMVQAMAPSDSELRRKSPVWWCKVMCLSYSKTTELWMPASTPTARFS